MVCPKCGSEQPAAVECALCGVIVAKFQQSVDQAAGAATPGLAPCEPAPPDPSSVSAVDELKKKDTPNPLALGCGTLLVVSGLLIIALPFIVGGFGWRGMGPVFAIGMVVFGGAWIYQEFTGKDLIGGGW